MNNSKRIVITTILGLISGAIAVWFVNAAGDNPLPPEINLRMMITFGFMGFVIGISSLRWHWALHGLVIGGLVGLIEGLASYALINLIDLLVIPVIFGMAFGLLIELITSVGFKARTFSIEPVNKIGVNHVKPIS
jgi:hypothetical protein